MAPMHGGHPGPRRILTSFWFWFLYGEKGVEHFLEHGEVPHLLGRHGIGHGFTDAYRDGRVPAMGDHLLRLVLSPRVVNKWRDARRMSRTAREIMKFHEEHPSRVPNPEIFMLAFADLVKSPFYHQEKYQPGDSAPVKIAAEMQVRAIEELKRRIHEEMKAKKDAFELKGGRLSATELDYLLSDAKKKAGFVSHYSSLARRLWSEGHTPGEEGTMAHEKELLEEAKSLAQIAINHAPLYARLAAEFEKLAKEKA